MNVGAGRRLKLEGDGADEFRNDSSLTGVVVLTFVAPGFPEVATITLEADAGP